MIDYLHPIVLPNTNFGLLLPTPVNTRLPNTYLKSSTGYRKLNLAQRMHNPREAKVFALGLEQLTQAGKWASEAQESSLKVSLGGRQGFPKGNPKA